MGRFERLAKNIRSHGHYEMNCYVIPMRSEFFIEMVGDLHTMFMGTLRSCNPSVAEGVL